MAGSAWITHREAAELLGCHVSLVGKLIARGELTSRGKRKGCLSRAQVESLAVERRQAAERKRAEREAASARRMRGDRRPPDDEHEWLTVPQMAEILGVSRVAVGQRCRRGRLPFTWSEGRRWIRRDLLELVERARHAQSTRKVGLPGGERRVDGCLTDSRARSSSGR
jgi:excisionase family DNA binding protein